MPEEKESIVRIINDIQTGLVELFDLFRELRGVLTKLDLGDGSTDSSDTISGLFTEVRRPADKVSTKIDEAPKLSEANESHGAPEDLITPSEPFTPETDIPSDDKLGSISARVSRVLDPIAHELQTSEASAEVIAEFLQSAKNDLITKESPNEKVAADMDVVLKFLRARGKRAIRPEERENIQKRIRRWKAYLSM